MEDQVRRGHTVFQRMIERQVLKGNTRRKKSQMMLIDDSRIRRVARAICDPHKETGCAAAVRVPGMEEDQRAKETPGRQQQF